MSAPRSIRVNLRFGPRTPPELMKLIASLPPYKRARRLRQLIEQGWKHAAQEATVRGKQKPAYLTIGRVDMNVGGADSGLSTDVLALLGQSIRM